MPNSTTISVDSPGIVKDGEPPRRILLLPVIGPFALPKTGEPIVLFNWLMRPPYLAGPTQPLCS